MEGQFHVRAFRTADAGEVLEIWNTVLPASSPWNEPTTELCRKLSRNDHLVLVAEFDGKVVGALIAGYDGIRGWIYRLAIAPAFQRRGFGSAMLQSAEEKLRRIGCPKINLQVRADNVAVTGFYQQNGYRTEDRMSLGKVIDPAFSEGAVASGPVTIERAPIEPVPTIVVSDEIELSQIRPGDRDALVKHLNESDEIRNFTGTIPFPYSDFDARQWISTSTHSTLENDRFRNWVIRNQDGELIGSIGLMQLDREQKAEIGYWLAKPYWGRGLMTQCAAALCRFGFSEYDLKRIFAMIYAPNLRSASVLTKVGFTEEGTLRRHHIRDGEAMDVRVFGLLPDELDDKTTT